MARSCYIVILIKWTRRESSFKTLWLISCFTFYNHVFELYNFFVDSVPTYLVTYKERAGGFRSNFQCSILKKTFRGNFHGFFAIVKSSYFFKILVWALRNKTYNVNYIYFIFLHILKYCAGQFSFDQMNNKLSKLFSVESASRAYCIYWGHGCVFWEHTL